MRKIKVSIKTNQIGQYFLQLKKYYETKDGLAHSDDNKIYKCKNRKDAAEKFVLKSFQIDRFSKMNKIDNYNFNQIISQIEWAAMKLEDKEPVLSSHILKYKVIAAKYHDRDDLLEEDIEEDDSINVLND